MADLFIKIGFLSITIWDILDVLIVGYLIYQIYRLLRGSLAFNIFIALILIYVVSALVEILKMELLSNILQQFTNVGVLALLIVFQPEVRRFLTYLGRGTLKGRMHFIKRIFKKEFELSRFKQEQIREVIRALENMSKTKTGALIVLSPNTNIFGNGESGIPIKAEISAQLLESIFNKESPLHDGAVVISDGKIVAASVILPISENPDLPKSFGLRHRAGVGITEGTGTMSVMVSEETGTISLARNGKITNNLSPDQVATFLRSIFREFYDED